MYSWFCHKEPATVFSSLFRTLKSMSGSNDTGLKRDMQGAEVPVKKRSGGRFFINCAAMEPQVWLRRISPPACMQMSRLEPADGDAPWS